MKTLSEEEYELQEEYESLKKKKISKYNVTFDKNGDLSVDFIEDSRLSQYKSSSYNYYDGFVNQPNDVFNDCLIYVRSYNNRVFFKSTRSGKRIHMFLSDFDDVVRHRKFGPDNQIVGNFVFCKKGIKQGVRFVFE